MAEQTVSFEEFAGGSAPDPSDPLKPSEADRKASIAPQVSFEEFTKAAPAAKSGPSMKEALKEGTEDVAGAADFLLGVPGQIAGTITKYATDVALALGHDTGLHVGPENKTVEETEKTGEYVGNEVARRLSPNFSGVVASLWGDEADESMMGKANTALGKSVDQGAEMYHKTTGRPPEEFKLVVDTVMSALGAKGAKVTGEAIGDRLGGAPRETAPVDQRNKAISPEPGSGGPGGFDWSHGTAEGEKPIPGEGGKPGPQAAPDPRTPLQKTIDNSLGIQTPLTPQEQVVRHAALTNVFAAAGDYDSILAMEGERAEATKVAEANAVKNAQRMAEARKAAREERAEERAEDTLEGEVAGRAEGEMGRRGREAFAADTAERMDARRAQEMREDFAKSKEDLAEGTQRMREAEHEAARTKRMQDDSVTAMEEHYARQAVEAADARAKPISPSRFRDIIEILKKPAGERTPEERKALRNAVIETGKVMGVAAIGAGAYAMLPPDDKQGGATLAALAALPLTRHGEIALKDGGKAAIEHTRQSAYDAFVAKDAGGKTMGYLKLTPSETGMVPEVWVDPARRGNRVASGLYDKARDAGYTIRDDTHRTPEGERFRAKYDAERNLDFSGQRGSIDPKVLYGLAAGAAGITVGSYIYHETKNPWLALSGGFLTPRIGATVVALASRVKGTPLEKGMARQIGDELHKRDMQISEKAMEMLRYVETKIAKEVPDYQQHAERIYLSYGDKSIRLSTREQEIKTKYVDPILAGNEAMRQTLKGLGYEVGPDVPDYISRIVKGKSGFLDRVSKALDSFDAPATRSLGTSPPVLKARDALAMETPTGAREVITKRKGGGYTVWRNGRQVGITQAAKQGAVKWQGRDYTVGQGTVREIESHTDIRYHHDPIVAAMEANQQLARALSNAQAIENIKNLPSFDKIGAKIADAPAEWVGVSIPQFNNYRFAPHVAYTLQDFSGEVARGVGNGLGKISRLITGAMFWDPLPHLWNVATHSFVERGLSRWTTPGGYIDLAKTSFRAWKAVTEQNSDYMKFMHEGGGLMYPKVLLENFQDRAMKALGTQPQMGLVAKAFGYADAGKMLDAVYRFSRHILWGGNDIMMMQAYFEKEAMRPNMSPQEVIREVEKHIPNYRIPGTVMGSRIASQLLQNPLATAFGRYDYGRLASYGHLMGDIIKKNVAPADRLKAMDQVAALAVLGLVLYPMLGDAMARAITGNQHATAQRFGAATIPQLVYEYFHKDKDLNEIFSSAFPSSPLITSAVEAMNGHEAFTGKTITKKDIPRWVASKVQPLGEALKMIQGKETGSQFLAKSVGIKSPNEKQVAAAEKRREKRKSAGGDTYKPY